MEVEHLIAWDSASELLYKALQQSFNLPDPRSLWHMDEVRQNHYMDVLYDSNLVPARIINLAPVKEVEIQWTPSRWLDFVKVTFSYHSASTATSLVKLFNKDMDRLKWPETEIYPYTEVSWRDAGDLIRGEFAVFPGLERIYPQHFEGNILWRWEGPLPKLSAGRYEFEYVKIEYEEGNVVITLRAV